MCCLMHDSRKAIHRDARHNAFMWRKSLQKLLSKIGILLILLNVLAPTVSHALRLQDPTLGRTQHALALAMAGDWCVVAGEVGPGDFKTLQHAVSLSQTLDHLKACDFCDDAPVSTVLPKSFHLGLPTPPVESIRFKAYAAEILRRPAYQLPESRAPPHV